MFDRILVPLDRSPLAECVLPHAIALAHALDAQVMLLHVLSLPDQQAGLRAVDALEWQLRRAEAESYLNGVCAQMKEAGVTCEMHVTDGDAAEQIVDFARDNAVGLVLIASHGQSDLSAWRVSSVAQKVIERTGGASLMLVRATHLPSADIAAFRYHRVLAPLDGSTRAECVLPVAAALTRVPDTQILLAHVVERPAMPRRTPLSQEDNDLAERLVDRNYVEADHYLEVVRSQLPPAAVDTRLLIGTHVADSLHALVDQEQIDLVLLSAHGYSGRVQWPYGGLVASFVAYGSCPLFIFQDAPATPDAATMRQEGRR